MIEYIMWKFINRCSIILYRTLFMSNIFTLVIYKLATFHCQWLLPNQFVLCVWVLLCFVHACFLTCLICESCEQNFRMLFPAHQFIKFQKSCAIQLFYFWLLGRGGGEGRVAFIFYIWKRCIEIQSNLHIGTLIGFQDIEGLEILDVRIYDQTMVEAVNWSVLSMEFEISN